MKYTSVPATLFMVFAAACASEPTGPIPGAIAVFMRTSGGDPYDDKMMVVVDAGAPRPITAHGSIVFRPISPGTYTVALEGVAGNCTLNGPNPLSVTVPSGKTVDVAVAIDCATTGFQVTTRTTGYANPFNYQVLVDDPPVLNENPIGAVDPNGSLFVNRAPGTYAVTLAMPGPHCKVVSGQPITVDVSNRAVTPVHVEITCVPPVWPERIAYVAGSALNSPQPWITLANPDGSGAVELVIGHSPAWSPDGNRLVFSTTQCDYYGDCAGALVLMDPDVRQSVTLVGTSKGFDPAWAPSGDRIAFISLQSRLWVLGLDGSPAVEIPIPSAAVSKPTWSPDGRRIACLCSDARSFANVCVVNRDGSGLERLTTDDIAPDRPAWSPDGRRIAFSIGIGGNHQIAVMAADGSGLARITEGYDVAWSRDGTKLVFTRGDGLFTADVDGSHVKRLTTGFHYEPAWRP